MSKPGKTLADQIGLGLLADNPSPIPSYAKTAMAAYNQKMREERIVERNRHETLQRMVDTFQALGVEAEISPTVPTVWNWEIEFEEDDSESEDSDYEDEYGRLRNESRWAYEDRLEQLEYEKQHRDAYNAWYKEEQAKAAAAAFAKRLKDRAAAVAAAVIATVITA